MRLLIVEDHDELAELIVGRLAEAGFPCDRVARAEDARLLVDGGDYAGLLLDLGLPDGDGLDLLAWTRQRDASLPVLILTARSALGDRVAGLNAGADDYLAKPFHTEELLARLRALLRRSAGHAAPSLSCGALRLDPRAARASVNGEPLRLTSLEYRLLHYMMMHQGRVIGRTELVEHLYDQDFDRDSNTIEVFIGRLRKKLGADRIETVRGLGYRLTPLAGEAAD